MHFRYEQNAVVESQILREANSTCTPELVVWFMFGYKNRSMNKITFECAAPSPSILVGIQKLLCVFVCALVDIFVRAHPEKALPIYYSSIFGWISGILFFNCFHATFSFHCLLRVGPFGDNRIAAAVAVVVVVAPWLFFVFHWQIGRFIDIWSCKLRKYTQSILTLQMNFFQQIWNILTKQQNRKEVNHFDKSFQWWKSCEHFGKYDRVCSGDLVSMWLFCS